MARASPAASWQQRALKLPGAVARDSARTPPMPQLPTLVSAPPGGPDFLHELKFDGYRLLASMSDAGVRLWSRHAIDWTTRLSPVAAAVAKLSCRSALLDGELIAGGGLQSDFSQLQDAISKRSPNALSYVVFDLLEIDGVDVRGAPLIERKALLAQLLATPPPRLALSTHVAGRATEALALSVAGRFEGIVSKRAQSPYTHGRNDDWVKTKNSPSEDLAVVGFVPGEKFGPAYLLLARPGEGGRWIYAGRIRPQRRHTTLDALDDLLQEPYLEAPSVRIDRTQLDVLRGAIWFEPRFVVEVNQRGFGEKSQFRQATMKALRADKLPADLLS